MPRARPAGRLRGASEASWWCGFGSFVCVSNCARNRSIYDKLRRSDKRALASLPGGLRWLGVLRAAAARGWMCRTASGSCGWGVDVPKRTFADAGRGRWDALPCVRRPEPTPCRCGPRAVTRSRSSRRASARWSACPRATSRRRWVEPAPDPHLAGKLAGCSGCSAREVRAEASSPGRSGAAVTVRTADRRRSFSGRRNSSGAIGTDH